MQSRIPTRGGTNHCRIANTLFLSSFTENPHEIWIHHRNYWLFLRKRLPSDPSIVKHLPYLVVGWLHWNSHCHDDEFHGNGPEPETTRSMRRNSRILFMVFIFAAWNVDEKKMFENFPFEFLSCCKNNERAEFFSRFSCAHWIHWN